MTYSFVAKIWVYTGEAAWHFITVPKNISDEIRMTTEHKAGFGSVHVEATIGATTWRTSLFPDSKSGCYFLPVKKQVRNQEKLEAEQDYSLEITVTQ